MEELVKILNQLKAESEIMREEWADEICKVTQIEEYDVYSSKTDKAFEKISKKYAKAMYDNLKKQREIEEEIDKLKEKERKKLYKDS